MQGGKAGSGKRRGRGKKRPEKVAAPISVDGSTPPRTGFIPEQLETLKAIETLIGAFDLTGEQAAVGEEMVIELQAASGELAALRAGAVSDDAKRTNKAARRVNALAETFSGLLADPSNGQGGGGNS